MIFSGCAQLWVDVRDLDLRGRRLDLAACGELDLPLVDHEGTHLFVEVHLSMMQSAPRLSTPPVVVKFEILPAVAESAR